MWLYYIDIWNMPNCYNFILDRYEMRHPVLKLCYMLFINVQFKIEENVMFLYKGSMYNIYDYIRFMQEFYVNL